MFTWLFQLEEFQLEELQLFRVWGRSPDFEEEGVNWSCMGHVVSEALPLHRLISA